VLAEPDLVVTIAEPSSRRDATCTVALQHIRFCSATAFFMLCSLWAPEPPYGSLRQATAVRHIPHRLSGQLFGSAATVAVDETVTPPSTWEAMHALWLRASHGPRCWEGRLGRTWAVVAGWRACL